VKHTVKQQRNTVCQHDCLFLVAWVTKIAVIFNACWSERINRASPRASLHPDWPEVRRAAAPQDAQPARRSTPPAAVAHQRARAPALLETRQADQLQHFLDPNTDLLLPQPPHAQAKAGQYELNEVKPYDDKNFCHDKIIN
jgi:hypothetical protein